MMQSRVTRARRRSAAHLQNITGGATRIAGRLFAQRGDRCTRQDMSRAIAGRLRRTDNTWPIGTSARRLSSRLDDIEDRSRAATLAGARDLKVDGFDRAIFEDQSAELRCVDN